jgi:hypothetical protein
VLVIVEMAKIVDGGMPPHADRLLDALDIAKILDRL